MSMLTRLCNSVKLGLKSVVVVVVVPVVMVDNTCSY